MQRRCVRIILIVHRGRQKVVEGVVESDCQVIRWIGNEERRSVEEFELKRYI